MKNANLVKLLNLWPPFLGSGIRIKQVSSDFREIDVEMKLRFWNRNYVGTQFGGSLYAMTDPFIMLILIENLGPEYLVWDKAASIRFKRPGKGRVRAHFRVTEAELVAIREQVATVGKVEPKYQVQVLAEDGSIVAEVEKVLWVALKARHSSRGGSPS